MFFVIFLFQFEKNTMRAGLQNEKSSWSGLTPENNRKLDEIAYRISSNKRRSSNMLRAIDIQVRIRDTLY